MVLAPWLLSLRNASISAIFGIPLPAELVGRQMCRFMLDTLLEVCSSVEVSDQHELIGIVINSIHDLILTFLPVAIMKSLKMKLRIKIVLCVLMGMSIL